MNVNRFKPGEITRQARRGAVWRKAAELYRLRSEIAAAVQAEVLGLPRQAVPGEPTLNGSPLLKVDALAFTSTRAAQLLGFSRTFLHQEFKAGKIKRMARSKRFALEELLRYAHDETYNREEKLSRKSLKTKHS